jgi:branched-chain amino acid transport system substrate-binding protein
MRRRLLLGIAMVGVAGLLLCGYAAPTAAKPVKIGGIFPQTGPYAAVGKTVTEGSTLAVEEINKAGGIFGAPVENYWRDDELKPEVALRRARELVETIGVDFFTGTIHVGIAAALNAYAKDAKAFYGCLCTTPQDMAKKGTLNPYTLLPFPRMSQMAGIPADYFAAKQAPKSAYIIGADYAYGWITSAVFKERLQAHGAKVTGPEFHPLGAVDFSPYITKIMRLDPKPDVLVSCNFGMDFIHFVKQVYDFKLRIPILAASLTEDFAKGVGPEAMRNVTGMMYYYWEIDTPQSKAFVEKHKARFGYPPDAYAGDGYHVTMLLLNAVKEIGTTDKDKLMAYFEGRELMGLKGPERCRPKTHQFIQNIVIVRGKDPAKIKSDWDRFEVLGLAGYEGGEKYLLSYKELGWE